MKHFKRLFPILILLFIFCLPLIYYHTQLIAYLSEPAKLGAILLSASGVAAFGIQFILVDLGIFSSAALIDLVNFGWKNSAVRRLFVLRDGSARGDLWCWLLSVLSLYDFFALLFSFGLFYVISSMIVKAGNFQIIQIIPFAWLQFTIIFLLSDLKQYAWHRFMHKMPFWHLHKYHHSATAFNLVTNSRGHFLEKGILIVFDSILFSIVGAPVQLFSFFLVLREFYNQLLHSELKWSLGWFGNYLLISPLAHRLHHSNDPRFYDKNYGTFFIFWDKLFGTYATTNEPITLGIQNDPFRKHGFWWDMWEGMRSFVGAIKVNWRN